MRTPQAGGADRLRLHVGHTDLEPKLFATNNHCLHAFAACLQLFRQRTQKRRTRIRNAIGKQVRRMPRIVRINLQARDRTLHQIGWHGVCVEIIMIADAEPLELSRTNFFIKPIRRPHTVRACRVKMKVNQHVLER